MRLRSAITGVSFVLLCSSISHLSFAVSRSLSLPMQTSLLEYTLWCPQPAVAHRATQMTYCKVVIAPNEKLSRSRQTLSPDEAKEQRASQRIRKQKGWRLSAPAQS